MQAGEASLQDVMNMLVEYALVMKRHDGRGVEEFFVEELVSQIPTFQYGMDVNPYFTKGITGYEYTAQLTAFDMMQCKLVHGWLVDVADEETFRVLGTRSYNQLIEIVIHATVVVEEIERLRRQTTDTSTAFASASEWLARLEELERQQHEAIIIQHFLESSSHQLTSYGLLQLQELLTEGEMTVFFRNNHFATLTKHTDGHLYLLVTDLGYANAPAVVWERLDVIDGNTDFVNADFVQPGTPFSPVQQPVVGDDDNESEYKLALELSMKEQQRHGSDDESRLIAAVTEASLREFHQQVELDDMPERPKSENGLIEDYRAQRLVTYEDGDHLLAMQLQQETDQRSTSGEDSDRLLALQLQREAEPMPIENRDEVLARQLQSEENKRHKMRGQRTGSSGGNGCVIC